MSPTAARLLGTDDAARLLGVHPRWLQRAAAERAVPHYRIGRRLRFDPDELTAWRDAQRVEAEANMLDAAG